MTLVINGLRADIQTRTDTHRHRQTDTDTQTHTHIPLCKPKQIHMCLVKNVENLHTYVLNCEQNLLCHSVSAACIYRSA